MKKGNNTNSNNRNKSKYTVSEKIVIDIIIATGIA